MKHFYYLLCLCLLLFPLTSQAQLVVSSGQTADELVDNILGEGITIVSTTLNCPDGASGEFNDGNTTNIGVDAGILLTSGGVSVAPGPNNQNAATVNNGAPGDADLDALVSGSTFDACVLEFTFVPEGTSISFDYVFASEEYEEFFCTQFNDVFAFLITGPAPGGGSYSSENIALIPGTSLPVSINNVGPGDCGGVNNSTEYNNNAGGATIQYDGFINVFTATVDLVPCQEYTIKLAIADRGDRVLDSGVFIEAGSLVSTSIDVVADITPPDCPGGGDGEIDISVSGGQGIPTYSFLWSTGATSEDISGLSAGDYTVVVTDDLGCTVTETFTVPDGVDNEPPTLICNINFVVALDDAGNATIEPDDIAQGIDNCTEVTLELDVDSFNCILGDYPVVVTGTDGFGNSNVCTVIVTVVSDDEDCDTVADVCDLCPGGDDTVDNDNDGQPDCAFPPDFDAIIDEWKCGNNKVFMCHVPPGNPGNAHTICVNKNAIAAHIAHGDYLGPCGNASCEDDLQITPPLVETTDHSLRPHIYPNPTESHITIDYSVRSAVATVRITNRLGQRVFTSILRKGDHKLRIDVSTAQFGNGIYLLEIQDGTNVHTDRFVVEK